MRQYVSPAQLLRSLSNTILTSGKVEAAPPPKVPEAKTTTAYIAEPPELAMYTVGVYDADMAAATAANPGESITSRLRIDY